jgi:hypothetical protein
MHRHAPLLLALSLLSASCGGGDGEYASAFVMTSLDQGVGGPKAVARKGDLILENDHFRVAILGARNSLGPGLYGGSIVDADIQRHEPGYTQGRGKDQFAELFPTVNMNVAHPDPEDPDSVSVIANGKGGGPAVVRVSGVAEPFLTLLNALWIIVDAPDFWMSTDYIARPGVPWLELETTVTIGTSPSGEPGEGEPVQYFDDGMPLLDWAIETGLVVGEFYLSGGSVDVFAPGIGFDEDGAVYEAMQSGRNSFSDPFNFPFLAGIADGVSYGIAPSEGNVYVPLFTASQTVAVGGGLDGDGSSERFLSGSAYTFNRYFFIGHGDVGSIVDQYLEAREIPYGTVSGNVIEATTATAVSDIDVFVYRAGEDMPWSHWRTDVHPDDHVPDGSFGGRLPVGDWELLVHDRGRPGAKRAKISVKEDKNVALQLEAPRTGVLSFTVRDAFDRPVPAKVSLFREDDLPRRDPVLGDGFIGGSPEAVLFSLYGEGQVELSPGTYRAVASRGIEYEIDVSKPFTVDDHTAASIALSVFRSVDTEGWISGDLHVHGAASHDSGVVAADRVRTMVAEGVEFFSSTDHDYVVDYAPTVELLGMEEWVQTAVGNETTTIEVGHFLGFPLQGDFMAEAGANRDAIDWTDKRPQQLIDQMRELGASAGQDPMIFVGHPRDGILGYFDEYGFDPYSGTPGVGGEPGEATIATPLLAVTNPLLAASAFTWDFDALELLNGKRFELIRTPTQRELDTYADGGEVDVYDMMTRTLAEQEDLKNGVYKLGYGIEGHIDDWFTLLNLGYRFTVLGNSDTHGLTSVESGCPRNFIMSETDDPAFLDDQAVAEAVKAHRVVASYGPFVQMWVDDAIIGDELVPKGESVDIQLDVQAPTWIAVDRVELYENGTLIHEWDVTDGGPVRRFSETISVTPAGDSWYVAVALGDGDLAPVFTPVEIPYIELQAVVTEALSGVGAVASLLSPAVPIPKEYPIRPYAITNPIWVDLDGDGFDAPGLPEWLSAPEEPE